MDPVCHTLAGATLAQTGLKRWSPFAATTLLLGANLPDVDAVSAFWGGDCSLGFRRGWTHGVLGVAVLPLALAGLMLLVDRLRRWGDPDAAPARAAPLVALAYLSCLTHPALDWLNTYGVRLLMPFSDRWFYGDAVFIIDPWLWLLLAAPVVVATSRSVAGATGWLMLGTAATSLLLTAPEVLLPARAAWLCGVAAIVLFRLRGPRGERVATMARLSLAVAVAYILVMVAGSAVARRQALAVLTAEGRPPRSLMAGPVPANPFDREIIAVHDDRYTFHLLNVGSGRLRPFTPDIPINGPTPVTEAALAAPSVRGLRAWLRFPSYEVEPRPDGFRVTIRDVRYARFGARARGIGVATVDLDARLRPR